MNELNPEIEASLDSLSELICQSLTGESSELTARKEGLMKTLLMSGFTWKSDESLMKEVEDRVKSRCGEKAMHRGGALSSVASKLGKEFKNMAREQAAKPSNTKPSKAANISAATDA